MYQLNADRQFVNRTKSVFDSLVNIESTHKSNVVAYVSDTDKELIDIQQEPVEQISNSLSRQPVFKVPKVPMKRCLVKKQAAHQRNPEKWTKYSLADVKELGNGANYAAAMSFLSTRTKIAEGGEDEEMAEPIQFNRPLKKKCLVDADAETDEIDSSVTEVAVSGSASSSQMKKKLNRRNLRKKVEEEQEEEAEYNHCTIGLGKMVKKKSSCAGESVGMDEEDAEEDPGEAGDADANEAKHYDLFDWTGWDIQLLL